MKRSSVSEGGLVAAFFVATITLVFGDFAHDVAQWSICLQNKLVICGSTDAAEAIMIATMVSTTVAIYIAARTGVDGERTPKEARFLIIVAMVTAYLSLLKATVGEAGYPQVSLLSGPTLIYVVIAAIIFVSLGWKMKFLESPHQRFTLVGEIFTTMLVGLVLGGVLTFTVEMLTGKDHIIKVVVPITATAVFICLMRTGSEHPPWLRFWLVFSIVAALVYFGTVYEPRHNGDGWIGQSSQSVLVHALAYAGILTSGIIGTFVALSLGCRLPRLWRVFVALLISMPLSCVCVLWLDQAILFTGRTGNMATHELIVLHTSAPITGGVVAVISRWSYRRLRKIMK